MRRFRATWLLSILMLATTAGFAADTKPTPTIHEFSAGMKTMDGLFPLAWDAKTGHIFLQVGKFDQDVLFLTSLPYGLGSNDIGLDRGKLSEGVIVHFRRIGPKVLLIRPNLDYRSSSSNACAQFRV